MGPLAGAELKRAQELLTGQQLRAYGLWRSAAKNAYIAQGMGITCKRVRLLVSAAEKNLGYPQSYAPKQKGKGKPKSKNPYLDWTREERRWGSGLLDLDDEGWREVAALLDPFLKLAIPAAEWNALPDAERIRRTYHVAEGNPEFMAQVWDWVEKRRVRQRGILRETVLKRDRYQCRAPGCNRKAGSIVISSDVRRNEAEPADCLSVCKQCEKRGPWTNEGPEEGWCRGDRGPDTYPEPADARHRGVPEYIELAQEKYNYGTDGEGEARGPIVPCDW